MTLEFSRTNLSLGLCLSLKWCLAHGGHPVAVVEFHTVVETLRSGQPPASGPAEAGADVTLVRAGLKMGLGGSVKGNWGQSC